MAVRKKIRHDDETRAKIKAAQIINRLQDHVMGIVELSPAQVSSASTLLNKVLPNLQAVDMSVENDNLEWVASDRPLTREQYEKEFAQGTVEPAAGTANALTPLPN